MDNEELFLQSVKKGNLRQINQIIKSGVNPGCQNSKALLVSTKCGYSKLSLILLNDKRIDPTVNGSQCLVYACKNSMFEVSKKLLSFENVTITPDALMYAISAGSKSIVDILISDERLEIQTMFNNNVNAFTLALKHRYVGVVKTVINHRDYEFDYEHLILAANSKMWEVCEYFIRKYDVDVSKDDNKLIKLIDSKSFIKTLSSHPKFYITQGILNVSDLHRFIIYKNVIKCPFVLKDIDELVSKYKHKNILYDFLENYCTQEEDEFLDGMAHFS